MPEEATTPNLVDLVRSAYDASNRRDFDAIMSVYGRDAVWDMTPIGLGIYGGLAAIRGFVEAWVGGYEEWRVDPEEIRDLGGGITLAVALQSGRLAGSDGQVQWRYAQVSVWIERLAVRTTNYLDIDEARAAAERLAEERG